MPRPTYSGPHPVQQAGGVTHSREGAAQEVYRLIMIGETRAAMEAAQAISTLESAEQTRRVIAKIEYP